MVLNVKITCVSKTDETVAYEITTGGFLERFRVLQPSITISFSEFEQFWADFVDETYGHTLSISNEDRVTLESWLGYEL